jgi:regulator of cell morphogenesis and NO signaling
MKQYRFYLNIFILKNLNMHTFNKIFVLPDMKASEIIINNPYLILMFEHFEIKLEVREKTIEQICSENNINHRLFLTIANLFNGYKPHPITEYISADIQVIIKYLGNSHKYYIKEIYPQIQQYIKEILKINTHPEILMLEKFFNNYFIEVAEHLEYENNTVFPYVLNLDTQLTNNNINYTLNSYSVVEYREHHNDIEEKLTDLKNLLTKYLPIENDQHLRRKLLFSLFELEYDLNIHSQIEDTILIPLVEKMEKLRIKK